MGFSLQRALAGAGGAVAQIYGDKVRADADLLKTTASEARAEDRYQTHTLQQEELLNARNASVDARALVKEERLKDEAKALGAGANQAARDAKHEPSSPEGLKIRSKFFMDAGRIDLAAAAENAAYKMEQDKMSNNLERQKLGAQVSANRLSAQANADYKSEQTAAKRDAAFRVDLGAIADRLTVNNPDGGKPVPDTVAQGQLLAVAAAARVRGEPADKILALSQDAAARLATRPGASPEIVHSIIGEAWGTTPKEAKPTKAPNMTPTASPVNSEKPVSGILEAGLSTKSDEPITLSNLYQDKSMSYLEEEHDRLSLQKGKYAQPETTDYLRNLIAAKKAAGSFRNY
jgi:hypothetical protein